MADTIEIYENGVLISTEVLIDTQTDVEKEYEKYLKRKNDGERIFLELAAELRLAKVAGILNEAVFNSIEDTLIPVRNEVIFGQWRTGLRKLEGINPQNIGEDLHTRLTIIITNYITENY